MIVTAIWMVIGLVVLSIFFTWLLHCPAPSKRTIWQSPAPPVPGKKLKRQTLDYYLNYVSQSTPVLIYEDQAETWILYTE